MADIKDMSREEIEQYLASMPKDTTEPSAKQEVTAAETMRGADGNYDIGKVNLSQMFSDRANELSLFDRGSEWQAYIDKNITDPAAKADMESQIYAIVSANPNMSPTELKYRLRAVEANLRRRYPNSVSKHFDISGIMRDKKMAEILLSLGLKGDNRPVETKQPDITTPPAAETPKPEKPKGPTTNDELNAAFKRIKNKQASDADLALFSEYSEEQLKKMGFGPISIAAIKGTTQSAQSGSTEGTVQSAQSAQSNSTLSDDDKAFMTKYKQYTQQLSGVQPRSQADIKKLQESEPYKFVRDPDNVKRYQEILKIINSAQANKTNETNETNETNGKTPQQ